MTLPGWLHPPVCTSWRCGIRKETQLGLSLRKETYREKRPAGFSRSLRIDFITVVSFEERSRGSHVVHTILGTMDMQHLTMPCKAVCHKEERPGEPSDQSTGPRNQATPVWLFCYVLLVGFGVKAIMLLDQMFWSRWSRDGTKGNKGDMK